MENKKTQKKFKFLEHTADVKFQAFGNSLEKVFENSALALKEIICGKIKIKENKEVIIKVKGKDFESLLYNFLEEIIYLLDAKKFIISKINHIEIKNFKLKAILIGDKASNYKFNNGVKAITYNEMFVKHKGKNWISQVVIDV
jgi:SHS2 domain-containing protein